VGGAGRARLGRQRRVRAERPRGTSAQARAPLGDRPARAVRRSRGDPREAAPLFLPHLGDGERDEPALCGAFVGLSLRHDRPAPAFAVLEGLAFGVRGALAELEAAGSPSQELQVSGGGARLSVLSQIKAVVLRRPVIALKTDAAAVGAALPTAPAAGLGGEAGSAVGSVLAAARQFEPAGGADPLARRLAWYQETVVAQRPNRWNSASCQLPRETIPSSCRSVPLRQSRPPPEWHASTR
jgi:sugar (pentulose or hexulose) kinase